MIKKNLFTLFFRTVLIFTCLLLFSSFTLTTQVSDTTLFFETLHEKYENDYEKILVEVEKNLNSKLSSYERGQNLLAYMRYNRLLFNYDVVLENSEYVEDYLSTHYMYDELLYLYSILTNSYRLTESTKHMSYLYMHKGEVLSKKLFSKNPTDENLAQLLAIMYLKSVSALEIELYDEAELTFAEARVLQKNYNIPESLEMCDSIFTYYLLSRNYSDALVHGKVYLDNMYNVPGQEPAYKRVLIRMGLIYVELGDFDSASTLLAYLNSQSFELSTRRQTEQAMLEAAILTNKGETTTALTLLINAYEQLDTANLYQYKLALIDLILSHYSNQTDQNHINYWLNKKITVRESVDTFEKERVLLSKLVDNDLFLANSRIELLKTQQSYLLSIIMTVILLLIIVISSFLFLSKQKKYKNTLLNNNLKHMDEQLHYQFQHYESIKEYQSYVRKLWHDLKNHHILLLSFIQNQEYDTAKQYILELTEQIDEYEQTQICNHKVIDALLSFKQKVCIQKNIKLVLDVSLPEDIEIDNFTIVTILGNLFDNAIEACEKIDTNTLEKYIKVTIHIKQNYLMITIENSKTNPVVTHKNHILTTKRDKVSHGLGLQSVQDSVNQHGGILKIHHSDTVFTTQILLSTQVNKSE
ncbi:MAG: GHKL domain-containing protein [Turicibacter sp.]